MKMQNASGITSITVEGVTYELKKGIAEVDDAHASQLKDFGFSPIDESIILPDAPTQEDIDHFHKAEKALEFIEAWNKDHPDAPIGPDAEALKAAYDAQVAKEKADTAKTAKAGE